MRAADDQAMHEWLTQAANGDSASWNRSLQAHRPRLDRMAVVRLAPRLQGRGASRVCVFYLGDFTRRSGEVVTRSRPRACRR
jgi:hypothetical protein